MKILKILASIVLVLVLLLILLPIIFKGRISKEVQTLMADNLKAEVSVGDIDLSLISTFPDFNLIIEDILIVGTEEFEGVGLAEVGLIEARLDIMSVLSGEQIKVKRIGLADCYFHIVVNEDSVANYEIVKAKTTPVQEEQVEEVSEEPSPFSLGVQEYYLRNINLIYEDIPGKLFTKIEQLDHSGSGDMTLDVYNFVTQTNVAALTFKMGRIKYLTEAELDVKLDVGVDMLNKKYSFNENHVGINDLMLNFDGYVALPDSETTELDITFNTEQTSFKSILSLVPVVYTKDFESVKTSGRVALGGMVKGELIGSTLPAFKLDLQVEDGRFQYPDLPKAGENIQISLHVMNNGGSEDNTVVDIEKFHIELAGNPIDLKAGVTNPISDPNIDASLTANVDLSTLSDVIPTENGEEMSGLVNADVSLKGLLSTLEKEDYENFDASGSLILEKIKYLDPSLGYPIMLNKADFAFSPRRIELAELDCKLGESDIQAKGYLGNYLPFYFHDSTISGDLSISSELLNLNQLAGSNEDTTASTPVADTASGDTSSMEVIEIPGNVDFVLTTSFNQVMYDNMTLSNMVGKVTVRDEKVSMDNLSMELLKGKMSMNGYYETSNKNAPTVDFGMDIDNFDIPEAYATFNTLEKMAPIAEHAIGKFSSDMKFVAALNERMEPVMESISGGGSLQTKEVMIKQSNTLDQLAVILKNDKLKDPRFEDVDITYEFVDGRVNVKPFDVEMADYKATISGSNGFDGTLDYLVETEVPMEALGKNINKLASNLLGELNKKAGTNVQLGETIPIKVKIGGTVKDPKLRPVLGKSKSKKGNSENEAFDDAKDQAKKEIENLKKQAEDSLRNEADRIRKQAEDSLKNEGERLKKEAEEKAKEEADRLKKEAEEKAKEEAERLKNEAKKGLEGLFKKK